MLRVTYDELEDANDGYDVLYFMGEFFSGIAVEDSPRSETAYDTGRLHGPERSWYDDGVLESEAYNRAGVRHGPLRKWNRRGLLVLEQVWDRSSLLHSRRFDEEGVLLSERSELVHPLDLQEWRATRTRDGPRPTVELVNDKFVEVVWAFDHLLPAEVRERWPALIAPAPLV